MKNAIIAILALALVAAAFLTRPTEDDFEQFVLAHAAKDRRSPAERFIRPSRSQPTLEHAEFYDRILWVEIRKDGKTLYAGAFNHWWHPSGRMERV
jgi:hypothetical protein